MIITRRLVVAALLIVYQHYAVLVRCDDLPPPGIIEPGLPPPGGEGGCDPIQETCKLTAGIIDDSLNFITYEIYKQRTIDADTAGLGNSQYSLPNPNLADRLVINVKDEGGNPFSCATVEVEGTDVKLSTGTNGKLALFPDPLVDNLPPRPWTLIPSNPTSDETAGTAETSSVVIVEDDGSEFLELVISNARSFVPDAMDLAVVLDTTGSMCDELDFLQDELDQVLSTFTTLANRPIDLRLGFIFYRDVGDEYVTINTGFFQDPVEGLEELANQTCGGGGDFPEAVHTAWESALAGDMVWREGNVARVALLVGDAPPHRESINAAYSAVLELRKKGVALYGLAGSGTDRVLEYLLRLASLLTGGQYLWLTADSGIGNDRQDAKVACFQVTEMQNLLTRVLLGALEGQRFEANDEDIIRERGNQTAGICLIDLNDPESSLTSTGNDGADFSRGDGGDFAEVSVELILPFPTMAPTEPPTPPEICFPGDSTVQVMGRGTITMKELKISDMVHIGNDEYSRVYSFGHVEHDNEADYLAFESNSLATPLELSSRHMVSVVNGEKIKVFVPASSVRVGDRLVLGSSANSNEYAMVTKVSNVVRKGAFAPFTMSGTIAVNGVVASNYISLEFDSGFYMTNGKTRVSMQWLAHAFQAPHRMVCHYYLVSDMCQGETYNKDGLSSWVTLLPVGQWIFSRGWVWKQLLFVPVVLAAATAAGFEQACLHIVEVVLFAGGVSFLLKRYKVNRKRV